MRRTRPGRLSARAAPFAAGILEARARIMRRQRRRAVISYERPEAAFLVRLLRQYRRIADREGPAACLSVSRGDRDRPPPGASTFEISRRRRGRQPVISSWGNAGWHAGLVGLERGNCRFPPLSTGDPGLLSPARERRERGIADLPRSLGEGRSTRLDAAAAAAMTWLGAALVAGLYVMHKAGGRSR